MVVFVLCRSKLNADSGKAYGLRTLANRLNTLANRLSTLANRTLAKRLVSETTCYLTINLIFTKQSASDWIRRILHRLYYRLTNF